MCVSVCVWRRGNKLSTQKNNFNNKSRGDVGIVHKLSKMDYAALFSVGIGRTRAAGVVCSYCHCLVLLLSLKLENFESKI